MKQSLFLSLFLGVLTLISSVHAETTPTEAANILVVKKLIDAFQDEPPQPEKVAALLTDDAYMKWAQTDPPAVGRAAILQKLQVAMKPGAKFRITVSDTYAAGAVVINKRADQYFINGGFSPPAQLIGFFVVENGKIKTWVDYIIPNTDKAK